MRQQCQGLKLGINALTFVTVALLSHPHISDTSSFLARLWWHEGWTVATGPMLLQIVTPFRVALTQPCLNFLTQNIDESRSFLPRTPLDRETYPT